MIWPQLSSQTAKLTTSWSKLYFQSCQPFFTPSTCQGFFCPWTVLRLLGAWDTLAPPFPALPHDLADSHWSFKSELSFHFLQEAFSAPPPAPVRWCPVRSCSPSYCHTHCLVISCFLVWTVHSVKVEAEIIRFSWYPSTLYRVENKCSSEDWMVKRTTFVLGELCVNANIAIILWQLLLETHHLVWRHGGVLGDIQSCWHRVAL